jgi:hypothetical protein
MASLGYPYEVCVFNRRDTDGTQCKVAVHIDDLLIVSASKVMIEHLTVGLKSRYGEI